MEVWALLNGLFDSKANYGKSFLAAADAGASFIEVSMEHPTYVVT